MLAARDADTPAAALRTVIVAAHAADSAAAVEAASMVEEFEGLVRLEEDRGTD
jgi:hypothetical protein